ncbi:murein L,D-transpeptidase [Palleronia sp. LCG004]|uniref:L,D-transpeptidase family protein n=1 Tax=Palleronia sp. LCG004 TaxID=3079304 RepID=UPI0029432E19|nr:L,D-transpeptidase family protein [Palleronia sp. LCG004]WOI56749.1 L,D-transpeptidase family protein [Palleronia sp. LCG004]
MGIVINQSGLVTRMFVGKWQGWSEDPGKGRRLRPRMIAMLPKGTLRIVGMTLAFVTGIGGMPAAGATEITAFKQAVAIGAAEDPALSDFYREINYRAIWTGSSPEDRERRAAFLSIVGEADVHGLPQGIYDEAILRDLMGGARNDRDRGRVEAELSRLLLTFVRHLETGILVPSEVDRDIKREVPRRDGATILREFARAEPYAYLTSLAPRTAEYAGLVREKAKLERIVAAGGYGPTVPAGRLELGASGMGVLALRDRLISLGYLPRTETAQFDAGMELAVEAFQADHGLNNDGIVGGATLAALNRSAAERLGQVLVAMERERWMNRDLGDRHILVNLTDFRTRIVVEGETIFETRSVIGADKDGQRTPEFSDEMDHIVINPSWYVPRSIVVNEYLPALRRNPYALGYMEITDRQGRVVNRGHGFAQYSAGTFPFAMRQPPGPRNALGLVKFMFPNRYNIYLHDTPAKNLFSSEVRAFSHGCIRLGDPFDFAYALLGMQSDDPEGEFQRHLRSGRETRVNLETPVPVHLIYRTAIAKPGGGVEYRGDIYGRDARILAALGAAGVALPGPGS